MDFRLSITVQFLTMQIFFMSEIRTKSSDFQTRLLSENRTHKSFGFQTFTVNENQQCIECLKSRSPYSVFDVVNLQT